MKILLSFFMGTGLMGQASSARARPPQAGSARAACRKENAMTDTFCFGGLRFVIHADFDIPWRPEELAFRKENATQADGPQRHYYIRRYDKEPSLPDAPLLYDGKNQKVYQGKEGEIRIHYLYGTEISMYCEERADGRVNIQVLPVIACDAQMYLFALMLERVLLEQKELLLHCAYLKTPGGAVLFTAPSETGKSTQADLWSAHRSGCEVINGDRAILKKEEGAWKACGLPLCGSSGISRDVTTPIRAIVYLRQAPEDSARRLRPLEAYMKVASEISVNYWNRERAEAAMDLMQDLIQAVPVFLLDCTPKASAVDALDERFREEGI